MKPLVFAPTIRFVPTILFSVGGPLMLNTYKQIAINNSQDSLIYFIFDKIYRTSYLNLLDVCGFVQL